MKQGLNKYAFCFLVFCAIFAPPFFKFNIMYILCLFMGLKLLKNKKFQFCIDNKTYLLTYICISFYAIVVVLFNELREPNIFFMNRMEFIYQFFCLIPCQFLMAIYFWSEIKQSKNQYMDMKKIIFGACDIEGVLVIISYLVPIVRQIFLNIMLKNSGNTRYSDQEFISYRAYGFADTLLDTFGYGMGLVVGLGILSKKKTKLEIITILLCSFSIIVNSRTGLAIVLVAIGIKICSVLFEKKMKINMKAIGIVCVLIVGIYFIVSSGYISSVTLSWIVAGFESVLDFVLKKNSNYTLGSMKNSMFSKDFWTLPDSFCGKLLGTGHSCFGTYRINGVASDVGYVNYIWIMGIAGTLVLLIFIACLFIHKIKNRKDKYEKIDLIFLMTSFFVMFIKGNIITYSAGTFITILLLMYKPKEKENNVFN